MVFLSVFWLNSLPRQNRISPSLSLSTIVTGRKIDCKLHCQIEYGKYVQTHEQHDNSMDSRTVGALALQPTGNRQGCYYLFSLYSRRRIHHTHWTVIPMPEEFKNHLLFFVFNRENPNGDLFSMTARDLILTISLIIIQKTLQPVQILNYPNFPILISPAMKRMISQEWIKIMMTTMKMMTTTSTKTLPWTRISMIRH